jgi:DNA/RNA endonuclease YhcR with UshA esterase domain
LQTWRKNLRHDRGAIDVKDKTAIQSGIPHEVIVAGTVSEIKDIQGAATISFNGTEKSQFYAVVLKRNHETVEKVQGEGLKSLEGKHIQITGKIVDYRKRPEIIMSAPEQIAASGETKPSAVAPSKTLGRAQRLSMRRTKPPSSPLCPMRW